MIGLPKTTFKTPNTWKLHIVTRKKKLYQLLNKYLFKRYKGSLSILDLHQVWWSTLVIPAFRRQEQDDPWVQDQPVLHHEFQTSQYYTVRPCLIKREQTNIYVYILDLEVLKSEYTRVVKRNTLKAREVIHWIRAPGALVDDPGSVPVPTWQLIVICHSSE